MLDTLRFDSFPKDTRQKRTSSHGFRGTVRKQEGHDPEHTRRASAEDDVS